jgi:hypothetical protein
MQLVDDWTVEMIEQPGLPSGFYAEEYGMARLKWLDNFVQFLKVSGTAHGTAGMPFHVWYCL